MSLAWVGTRASLGLEAPSVHVEVHLSPGLPGLAIVGLPEAVVRESKDRVRSALLNSGFEFPHQRITINLAPADLPKEGGRFDLPIALGILAASQQIPADSLMGLTCIGELALSGELRPVPGILSASLAARAQRETLLVPMGNAREAALPERAIVLAARNLCEIVAHLRGACSLLPVAPTVDIALSGDSAPDLADVRGQQRARRALEIAAAGGHSLLLYGPPGAGKTLMATRLPGLLPPLAGDARLEVTAIHSLTGNLHDLGSQPPYRAPHHHASSAALIGGGSGVPRPGEISLAHQGVLFLDELPEFNRHALECLREPLESGEIVIARARHRVRYPARFQLIAAMNPCPCGQQGQIGGACRCTPEQLARYRDRVSGPLLDRLDLRVAVEPVPLALLQKDQAPGETSAVVRARVLAARSRQYARQHGLNATQAGEALAGQLERKATDFLQTAGERMRLSARAYHRVLRVARSIADLAGEERIASAAIAEALGFRGVPGDERLGR